MHLTPTDHASDIFYHLLMSSSDKIRKQLLTGSGSKLLMVFLKENFEVVDFEKEIKKSADDKKSYKKYPACKEVMCRLSSRKEAQSMQQLALIQFYSNTVQPL